jgi:hypothetical protein
MLPIRRLAISCLAWLVAAAPCFADSVYLQPEQVYLGDIAELLIEYEGSIPSLYALDTSKLETDFEMLDMKSRVSRVVEDGATFYRMQWRLQILARRSGSLTVPGLQVGPWSTPALTLEVRPAPPALSSLQKVFIELASNTRTPYVGQQTLIDSRLFYNVALDNSRLVEPQAADTTIYRQPGETVYEVTRNGSQFKVLERGLSLFPGKSGELLVTAASYSGTFESAPGAALAARTIHRRSKPLKLQVRKPPASFSGRYWLPASGLEISQSWGRAENQLQVGDSLDWTLTIVARGLPAESLPLDLLELDSERLRVYADQVTRSNRFDGKQIIGRLDQHFALVASDPGQVRLPAIELKWWDVERDLEQQARLAGKTINVIEFDSSRTVENEAGQGLSASFQSPFGVVKLSAWPGLMILLPLALLGYCAWRFQSRILALAEPVLRRRRIVRRLRIACLANDAAATRNLLLEWGREHWPGESTFGLRQIGHRPGAGKLAIELERLDAALYSAHKSNWRGRRLWRLIAGLNRRQGLKVAPPEYRLPRFYPDET